VRDGDTWAFRRLALFLVGALSLTDAATGANLMDLYTLAQASDPIYLSARYALEAAKQKRPESLSALLPALTASAADGRTEGRTRYTDTPEINRAFNADQWTLQLTQPIFRADRLLAYGEARASVEQALAQFDAARQDLMLRLSRAYFDAIVAERRVAAARAQLVALSEQLQAARHSFESGVASVTDVDDTRSRAASAQAQETGALNDLESARAALEAIIGALPEKLAPLRAEVTLPRPVPSDAAGWVQRAIEDNPSVKAAAAVAKAADYEVDRSRAQRLPSVDLIASYGGNYCYVRHYRRRNSLPLPEVMQGLLRMRVHRSPGQTL
jgi:outer membrane protein